jgi:nucleoside-diphosphate-sugar epimerase
MEKSSKALVTGGTGFIGSHLTEALVRKGVQVRCLVRKASDMKWLKGLPVETIYGDLNDRSALEKAVLGVDRVFHLAGVTAAIHKENYFEVNGSGTKHLIQACLEHNPHLQKFILMSSQAAGGPSRNGGNQRETDPSEPVSFYGRSKGDAEDCVIAHAHELPVLILRPSAVYGPRNKDIFPLFKCLSGRINPCPMGSDQHLSLCYVKDIVDGILLAAETRTRSGDIFFLSDGHDYRMDEIGELVARALGIRTFRIRIPQPILLGAAVFSEYLSKLFRRPLVLTRDKALEMIQKNWVCDITKAKAILGFDPKVSLSEGAELTFAWYKKEKWL